MNQAILIGRLTKEPEMRYLNDGTATTTFTLAVDRQNKAKGMDFIKITTWRKLAETCANNLDKGRLVAVVGSIRTGSYTTKQGQKQYTFEVLASSVQFLDQQKTEEEAMGKAQEMFGAEETDL